jgi:hypothetical protein
MKCPASFSFDLCYFFLCEYLDDDDELDELDDDDDEQDEELIYYI